MGRNKKLQDFLEKDDPVEWKELVSNAKSTKPIGNEIKKEYGFSWSSIYREADKRGYYNYIHRKKAPAQKKKELIIPAPPDNQKPSFKTRSFQIETSLDDWLKKRQNENSQYSKKTVFNYFLRLGLDSFEKHTE